MNIKKPALSMILACSGLVAAAAISGCDNKETVLDVETPSGEIEVERDKDTGAIDVEIDENK